MNTKMTQALMLTSLLMSSALQAQPETTDIITKHEIEPYESIEQLVAIKNELIGIKRYLQDICKSQSKSLAKQTASALGTVTKEGLYLAGSTIAGTGAALATHSKDSGILKFLGKTAVGSGLFYLLLKVAFSNLLPKTNSAAHIKSSLDEINETIGKLSYEIEYIERRIVAYKVNNN